MPVCAEAATLRRASAAAVSKASAFMEVTPSLIMRDRGDFAPLQNHNASTGIRSYQSKEIVNLEKLRQLRHVCRDPPRLHRARQIIGSKKKGPAS